ncbi:MAG: endonuclease V [Thermoplasmatales archaeon]|nr:endonuclease V [Thermoplasmatales archaeon]
MNLYKKTYEIVKQIPRGKVSTYGDVAIALGDIVASRAVGKMLNENPYRDVPCYRVVRSDGSVGGYAHGIEKKIELLMKDGIEVKDGKINLDKYLFNDFKSNYPLKKLRKEQENLRRRIVFEKIEGAERLAGVDVAYGKYAYGAYVECENYNITKVKVTRKKIEFPYIPTYLAYRELPVLQDLIKNENPDVVLVDGNGLLHPRFFGIACHFGVINNLPTIGVAKKLLTGSEKNEYIFIGDKKVGLKINKFFISPGNRIDIESSKKIFKKLIEKNLNLVHLAHLKANEEKRKEEK